MRFLISPYKKQWQGRSSRRVLLQLAIGGIDLSGERESSRILTVYYTYLNQGKDRRPLIRLQGKWLQDLGFLSGEKIEVTESNGGLFIKARRRETEDDSHAGH